MNLSPETKLLLYCSRTDVDEETATKARDVIRSGLDWDRVVDDSFHQGVAPLLYASLQQIGDGLVPVQVMQKLGNAYYTNLRRNMLLCSELGGILRTFRDAGISTMVLKGVVLGEQVYRNIAFRPVADIDLLIREGDLPKAEERLLQMGYHLSSLDPIIETVDTKWVDRVPSYTKGEGSNAVHIDLHIDTIMSSLAFLEAGAKARIDIESLWERSVPTQVAGVDVLILCLEDLLLHLCLHSIKHVYDGQGGARLIWWCDIAEIVRYYRGEVNWEHLVQMCEKHKLQVPVYHSLYLVRRWFDVEVPDEVLKGLKPNGPGISVESVAEAIVNQIPDAGIYYKKHMLLLKGMGGMAKKMCYALRMVFPPEEYMIKRYSTTQRAAIYGWYLKRARSAIKGLLDFLHKRPEGSTGLDL